MTWIRLGSESGRAKLERMQRFEQADRVVMEVFADLHRRGKVREDVQTIYAELGEIRQVVRKSCKRPGKRINVKLV